MGYMSLLFLGIILVICGIINLRGDISTIHWYNRLKVGETDVPKYAKAMGLGTLIMGVSVILAAVLLMVFGWEVLYYIILAGAVAGGAVIFYAQFKYNKGIF